MKKILLIIFFPYNYLLFILAKVKFSKFKVFGPVVLLNKGICIFGSNIRINSSAFANVIGGDTKTSIVVNENATLIIGDNVSISNSAIYCTNEIKIDSYAMIGGSCKIWDTDFHPLNPNLRRKSPNENFKTKPIHIKESAFIGGGSIILKGVTIGKNSIIGAGSVVRESVPDNEIWAGNPACFIKKLKLDE